MIRSLLCGLWPWSQPIPRSAEDIQDDLLRCLAERRLLEEQFAEEDKACAERAYEMARLMEAFVRRVNNARLDSGMAGKSYDKIMKKCWTSKERDAEIALIESLNLLSIRRKSLQKVNEKICRLQDDLVEAVERESQDLPLSREQLDVEVCLPPNPPNTVDRVSSASCSGSDQKAVDWEAKMDAARRKFQASSTRCHQLVKDFDERLIEPMRKKTPYLGVPAEVDCLQRMTSLPDSA